MSSRPTANHMTISNLATVRRRSGGSPRYKSIQILPTNRARFTLGLTLCLAVLLAPACSSRAPTVSTAGGSREAAASTLEARAQRYWDFRRDKDLSGAYELYCSDYRARVTRGEFLKLTRLVRFDLQDLRVARVLDEGGTAKVTVGFRFTLPTLPDQLVNGETTDDWKRDVDGQWCKVDEPLVMPFPTSSPPR